jgi:hypothetical protein
VRQVEQERTAAPVAGGAQRALASVDVVGVKMTGDPNVPSGQVRKEGRDVSG